MSTQKLLPPLAALRAFEAVGRVGGIRRAAKELSIDHAVVSRHIRSLEAWVGVELIKRRATGNELTVVGQGYHAEINRALTAIMSATGELMKSEADLRLCLWCIPGFAWLWLADRLNDFITANPDVQLEFRPTDQFADFRSHEVDADIRYLRDWERASLPKLVYQLDLARPIVIPVASPDFVARMAPIESQHDLLEQPLLHEENDSEWHHWLLAQNCVLPERLPGARLWHAHLTLNAARQGQGIALANSFLLADDMKEGRLVEVRPTGFAFEPVRFGSYCFIAREDRWNSPAIVRFRKWLRDTAAAALA